MDKFQWFNSLKFTRDEKTGYFLNSTVRKRMHRYVWEFYKGEIPKGFHIHHIDEDKSNNDISNLLLISASEHSKMHSKDKVSKNYDKMIVNLNEKARPKASEWHGSEEGKNWHKEQFEVSLGKWKKEAKQEIVKCLMCEKEFKKTEKLVQKYCSAKCKSKHRRLSGIDNVKRNCVYCKKEFEVNKYSKAKHCSRSCTKKNHWQK